MSFNNPEKIESVPGMEAPHSLELARELEEMNDDEVIHQKLGELLKSIETDLGVSFDTDVGPLYDRMMADNCLVRVERLSRVLETVELTKPLRISDEDERHYANAVIPSPEGIKIALAEGQAPGPVRIMVGFGKTLVGFKTDHVSVSEVEFGESDIRDPRERRYITRHVVGELPPEDIHYIVIRLPSNLVGEECLSNDEKKMKPRFIFRGLHLAYKRK